MWLHYGDIMIVGIFGFIGSGKTTVGELLKNNGYTQLSFADSLKDAVSVIFGWDRALLEGNTIESREFRETPDIFWSDKFGRSVTPRWVLQYFGTDVCRTHLLEDIWLSSLEKKLSQHENIVITDVRFTNEIDFLRKRGAKFLQVNRDSAIPPWFKLFMKWDLETFDDFAKLNNIHESEYSWLTSPVKRCILDNNGNISDLNRQLTNWINT